MSVASVVSRVAAAGMTPSLVPARLLRVMLTGIVERALNRRWFDQPVLKATRDRLNGKTLRIDIAELDAPLVLVFGERQLDIMGQWDEVADCTITTRFAVLMQLGDRQQLSPLMRSGELLVDGDIQVIQLVATLWDLSEWDAAEFLAPYVGDIVAEGVMQRGRRHWRWLQSTLQHKQQHVAENLTEEWRLLPNALEVAWFNDEVNAVVQRVDALSARIEARIEKIASSGKGKAGVVKS